MLDVRLVRPCVLAVLLATAACGSATPVPASSPPPEACPAVAGTSELVAVAKFEATVRAVAMARAEDSERTAVRTELYDDCPAVAVSSQTAQQLRDTSRDWPGDVRDELVLDGTLDAVRDGQAYDVVTLTFRGAGTLTDGGMVLAFCVDRATTRVVLAVRLLGE